MRPEIRTLTNKEMEMTQHLLKRQSIGAGYNDLLSVCPCLFLAPFEHLSRTEMALLEYGPTQIMYHTFVRSLAAMQGKR